MMDGRLKTGRWGVISTPVVLAAGLAICLLPVISPAKSVKAKSEKAKSESTKSEKTNSAKGSPPKPVAKSDRAAPSTKSTSSKPSTKSAPKTEAASESTSPTVKREYVFKPELNSVVIDIRDSGSVFWATGIKVAEESGAEQVAVWHPEKLFDRLEKHKVYPIARIACFLDDYITVKHPDRAVQTADGKVWTDKHHHHWLDPYNKKNWEFLGALADFAMDQGFQEIQLDYVRFPSEGKVTDTVFPAKKDWPNPKDEPADVIVAYANYIRERVKTRGRYISADIFGIISSNSSDQGIGQFLEKIAVPFDSISPMVYPSHFADGEYGIKKPNSNPHDVTYKCLRDYTRRLPGKNVRPWLQDFSIYGVKYGKAEVQAQIKAARENGYTEYLLWNPRNRYTEEAVIDT
ncbi:hypothetical protein HY256_00040, partial [Candidatus Sumerlaeota bacterium]|nr:hypothetical protein [Candidatus Sumerlaeota bacterium]